jgi:hypothetical protein
MKIVRRARIALLGVLTGAALAAALPGAASAGVLVASAPSCDNGVNEQPFQQFGDDNHYFLAPGGNFEGSLDGWGLNRASVVDDQEPWQVHGDGGSKALQIPSGSSVTTATMCAHQRHAVEQDAHPAGAVEPAAAAPG